MELKHKGYTIKIEQDDDPVSPREDDNIGTMACFHPRYDLGDKGHGLTPETLVEMLKRDKPFAMPLFLLDHSGLWLSASRFECDPQGWDTSRVGVIFVTAAKVRKEFGWKRITAKRREHVVKILEAEVEEYNDFLTGNVYGYVVTDKDGDQVGSCWGFIGDPEKSGVIDEAKGEAEGDLRRVGEQLELFPEIAAA